MGPYEPDLFHLLNEEGPPVGLSNPIDKDYEWNEEDRRGSWYIGKLVTHTKLCDIAGRNADEMAVRMSDTGISGSLLDELLQYKDTFPKYKFSDKKS